MRPEGVRRLVLWLVCWLSSVHSQLLINVRNQVGDVLQETISANVSDDTVTLEFQRSDGTLVTQFIDFRNDVQVLKALVLGEEERGQSQYQVMCFVVHFDKRDFISSDAMSKLRQKNPGTVRTPEEDRGRDNFTMDYYVLLDRSHYISQHIQGICAEATDSTYTRQADLTLWAALPGASELDLTNAVRPFPGLFNDANNQAVPEERPRCGDAVSLWAPCQCQLETCIGWYPCGLKYCKGKGAPPAAASSSYRCGIKTCKKCYNFLYYVAQKQMCLWDE